jgi:hypothetical protein
MKIKTDSIESSIERLSRVPTGTLKFKRGPGRPYKGNRKMTFKIPPWIAEKLTQTSTRMQVNKSECVTEALRLWLNV